MADPVISSISLYPHFYPTATRNSLPEVDAATSLLSLFKFEEPKYYHNTKMAQNNLLSHLWENIFVRDPVGYEAIIILWLICREIGGRTVITKDTETGEVKDIDTLMRDIFTDHFKDSILLNSPQIRFWRAKLALILANDLDNPHSREFLKLTFKGTDDPVFGISEGYHQKLEDKNYKFSTEERLEILKQIYDNLISKGIRKGVYDPLLEAECLMNQFELQALTLAKGSKLEPSKDLAYLKRKIDEVVVSTEKEIELIKREIEKLDRNPKYKIPAYIDNKISNYLAARITDEGWDRGLHQPYYSGRPMRLREFCRYRAQALKLQAQLTLLETRYNAPKFKEKMEDALKLLKESQSLVDYYGDDPRKITKYLKALAREFKISGAISTPPESKKYGDLLNLLSTEAMKATIYYKLGLHFQPFDATKSSDHFKDSEESLKTVENIINAIINFYVEKAKEKPPQGSGKIWYQDIYRNIFFWRDVILCSAKMLRANLYLAQNQKDKFDEAFQLLNECQIINDSNIIYSKFMQIDLLLRNQPIVYEEKIGTYFHRVITYADEEERVRKTEEILKSLLEDTSPTAKELEGSIKLAEAKVKIARYRLDESQLEIPQAILKILNPLIKKAQLVNKDLKPTPLDKLPYVRPNNGVFEDYELSSALQIRAEANYALGKVSEAETDYNNAFNVYPLNYYAKLGLADMYNWIGEYEKAKEKYQEIQEEIKETKVNINGVDTTILPSSVFYNINRLAKLGEAEVALRKKTLDPEKDPTQEIDSVIKASQEILNKSDERFMHEHALDSLVEALMTKKEAGKSELEDFIKLLDSKKIRDRAKANLYLKIADSFFFIQEFEKAKEILDQFEQKFSALLKEKPALDARYRFIAGEVAERKDPHNKEEIDKIIKAAQDLFASAEAKRDPLFLERAIKDLINILINEERFEEALALNLAAQRLNAEEELKKLSGKLESDKFEDAVNTTETILQKTDLKKIFEAKGLTLRWDIFIAELGLRQAEILTWTKNFEASQGILKKVDPSKLSTLQRIRVLIVRGNIASQWKKKQNFKEALSDYYFEAEKTLEELDDPNPGQELILVKTELYLNLANIFTYGLGVKDFEKALHYYELATQTTQQIKGNADLKNRRLAEIYSGQANLYQQEDQPSKAHEYFIKAKEALGQIKLIPEELEGNIARLQQNILEPQIKIEQQQIKDLRASESRFDFILQVPLLEDQFTPYLSNLTDERQDSGGFSKLNTTYLGFKGRPEKLFGIPFGRHLTIDIKGKIPGSSRFLEKSSDFSLPQYFRRPNFSLSGTYWRKKYMAILSYDLSLDDPRLNILYGKGAANLDGFFNHPYLQMKVGGVYNEYYFTYLGDYRKRRFVGIVLDYEIDLAELFKKLIDLNSGFLKFKLEATIPVWEFERELKHDYMKEDREEDRFISDGTVPWQGKAAVEVNLGKYGKIILSAGGTYQETSSYTYQSGEVDLSYQGNLYDLYKLLNGK